MTLPNSQRIDRLTPLADVIGKLSALARPVSAMELAVGDAAGTVLADDLIGSHANPAAPVALRDGWAVRAEALEGAGSYAPLPLDPVPAWVNAGEKLPAGADSVAPLDAVTFAGATAQAIGQVFPGENVLQTGDLARAGAVLRANGMRLRPMDVAVAALCGVTHVQVCRPRIALARSGTAASETTLGFVARVAAARGASAEIANLPLEKLLAANFEADALIAVGGTGAGRNDCAVSTLAAAGKVLAHGVAIAPGETSAIGQVGGKSVLLLPGRFDAALAAWLLVGHPLLDALSGLRDRETTTPAKLSKKIASAPGIAEVVPVRCEGGNAVPLASGLLSYEALGNASGWVLVPPESEGFAEGAVVEVRALP